MERKIILNLAMSLDGYICDEDGGFDWIVGHGDKYQDTKKQFSFDEFLEDCDTVVMGKRGYDDMPEVSIPMYEDKKLYVITNSEEKPNKDNVEFINGDVVNKIVNLKEEKGTNIWLYGGAVSIDPFIKANVIDEYVVGIIPCILGKGRKLFLDNNPNIDLHLKECTVNDGVTMLVYTKR